MVGNLSQEDEGKYGSTAGRLLGLECTDWTMRSLGYLIVALKPDTWKPLACEDLKQIYKFTIESKASLVTD